MKRLSLLVVLVLLGVVAGTGCANELEREKPQDSVSTPTATPTPTAVLTLIPTPTPTLATFFPLPTPTITFTPTPTLTATPTATRVVACTGSLRPYIDCGPSTSEYDKALLLYKDISSQYDSLLDKSNDLQTSFNTTLLLYERLNAQYMAGGGGVPYEEVAKARIALVKAGSQLDLVMVQIRSIGVQKTSAWEEVVKHGCEDLGICL